MSLQKSLIEWAGGFKRETMPDDIRRLVNMARFDLFYGPCSEEDWPGFTSATDQIREWLGDNLPVLYWYDDADEIIDYREDCETGEEYPEISRRDLVSAIVGRELSEYVG